MACRHAASEQKTPDLMRLAVLAIAAWTAAGAEEPERHGRKKQAAGTGVILSHHTFEKTLTYDDRLGDWLTSGGTMALRDRVQLMPPVPDRYGLFWNKQAVETSEFEIQFTFSVSGAAGEATQDSSFVAWCSPDNFTSSYDELAIVKESRNWSVGMSTIGLTLFGNRPNFRGLALVFLNSDRVDARRPSVTMVYADGGRIWQRTDFPQAEGAKAPNMATKYTDWTKGESHIKIRLSTSSAKSWIGASMMAPGTNEWPKEWDFKTEFDGSAIGWTQSFIGFSGYTGSSTWQEVNIVRNAVRNFDMSRFGEKEEELTQGHSEGYDKKWQQALEQEAKFINQKSQQEAVATLTKLLSEHIDHYKTTGNEVEAKLVNVSDQVDKVQQGIGNMVNVFEAYNLETQKFDPLVLKDHLVGIKSLITKDKGHHDSQMGHVEDLTTELKKKSSDPLGEQGRAKVKSAAQQVETLEEHVTKGSYQTGGLLMVMVVAVAALGLLFLNRMQYYEKKHYI